MKRFIIPQKWVALYFLLLYLYPCAHANEPPPPDRLLNEMTMEEKAGQVLMVGFNGTTLSKPFQRFLTDISCGGVILYRHNMYKGPEVTRRLCSAIKGSAYKKQPDLPIFIATDLEGGIVRRFDRDFMDFPSALEMSREKDLSAIEKICSSAALKLHSLGINMNLAPVIELGGYINHKRLFNGPVEKISECGRYFIRGFQKNGIIATAKHFPGNSGAEDLDGIGKMSENLSALRQQNFIPFQAAVQEGVNDCKIKKPEDNSTYIYFFLYWIVCLLYLSGILPTKVKGFSLNTLSPCE